MPKRKAVKINNGGLMNFRENVLKLLSNKIPQDQKDKILQNMENEAKNNMLYAAYLTYYYHEIEHIHEKHLKFEKFINKEELKNKALKDADLAFVTAILMNSSVVFEPNITEMFKWFELSSELGNPLADFEMGFYHYQLALEGEDNQKEKEIGKAVKFFKKAREKGVVEATLALAELYVEIDDEKMARKYFNEAIEKGESDGYLGIALIEYDNKNFEKAKKYLLKSYQADKNRVAAFYLGGMYFEENENEKGFFYMEESAKQGNTDAMFDLGVLYLDGELIKKDEKKAFEYFSEAANKGDAGAQFYLGVFYREGKVVQKDDEKARYWFEKSAEQGDEDAIEALETF